MARTRLIKPKFFIDEDIGTLPPLARLLFIGLWTVADREGILEDKPRQIKNAILGYDDCDVDELLNQLYTAGFIVRYTYNSKCYIKIRCFVKHQNPHKQEKPSEYPQPTEIQEQPDNIGTSSEQVPNNIGSSRALTFNPLTLTFNPLREAQAPLLEKYAFEGEVIKIDHKDMERWQNKFPSLNVLLEIKKLDEWYQKEISEKKLTLKEAKAKWFFQVAGALTKSHQKQLTDRGGVWL